MRDIDARDRIKNLEESVASLRRQLRISDEIVSELEAEIATIAAKAPRMYPRDPRRVI